MSDGGRFSLRAGASAWLWLTLVVIVLDQATKYAVTRSMSVFEEIVVLPMLSIMRLHNEGAAFSLLSTASGWQRWFFTGVAVVVSVGILIWLCRLPARGQGLLAAGLALVLGGAIGNVIDRIYWGHVVDFIRVHYAGWSFPAFNVADSAITVGAAMIILDSVLQWRREARGAEQRRPESGAP